MKNNSTNVIIYDNGGDFFNENVNKVDEDTITK